MAQAVVNVPRQPVALLHDRQLFSLLIQPGILQGQRSLVGKGCGQAHLLFSIAARLLPVHRDNSDNLFLHPQRNP